jgi:uncharacterized protein YjbJ (UPF0337 family)
MTILLVHNAESAWASRGVGLRSIFPTNAKPSLATNANTKRDGLWTWKESLPRRFPVPERNIDLDVTQPQKPGEDTLMDKDRIKGSARQAKGTVKEAAGKVLGDKKLETEGNAEKVAGEVQNAVGGLKDAARGK